MAEMCRMKGCPDFACMQASLAGERFALCLKHGRAANENRDVIEAQLADYSRGAVCISKDCGLPATCQVEFGGHWHNHCDACGKRLAEKLNLIFSIANPTRKAQTRPLRVFFKEPPKVRIEEVPPAG